MAGNVDYLLASGNHDDSGHRWSVSGDCVDEISFLLTEIEIRSWRTISAAGITEE